MPGGFVCSASMKGEGTNEDVRDVVHGKRPLRKLLTKEQRQFYAAHAPEGLALDDLSLLGPVFVLKLVLTPKELGRRLVGELWLLPDGTRILELSTKCEPSQAFQVAAETRAYLEGLGLELAPDPHTKTKSALEFYAAELARRASSGWRGRGGAPARGAGRRSGRSAGGRARTRRSSARPRVRCRSARPPSAGPAGRAGVPSAGRSPLLLPPRLPGLASARGDYYEVSLSTQLKQLSPDRHRARIREDADPVRSTHEPIFAIVCLSRATICAGSAANSSFGPNCCPGPIA